MMNQVAYPVIACSTRGAKLPCFVVCYFRKALEAEIYAMFPTGDATRVLEQGIPLTDETVILRREGAWQPATELMISQSDDHSAFALTREVVLIGSRSEVREQLRSRVAATPEQDLDVLFAAIASLT